MNSSRKTGDANIREAPARVRYRYCVVVLFSAPESMAAAEQRDHKASLQDEDADDKAPCVPASSETATIRSSADGLDLGIATVEQTWSNSTGLAETQQPGDGSNVDPLLSIGGGGVKLGGNNPEMGAIETRNSGKYASKTVLINFPEEYEEHDAVAVVPQLASPIESRTLPIELKMSEGKDGGICQDDAGGKLCEGISAGLMGCP